jgi:1-aminocyclopropane-1-carboxylate deaminase
MPPELLQLEKTFGSSILSKIDDPLLQHHHIELWLKRDDLLHPVVSGNKWRKLKHILAHALSLDAHTLISMGGAYSNHLHALAFVGNALGLKTAAFVRGEQGRSLTPTLQDAHDWGMALNFVSRTTYRELRNYKGWQDLPDLQAGQYWLPEGGAQPLALQGVAELTAEIDIPYDMLCAPCGTGTTLAGLIGAAPAHAHVTGFAALKNAGFLHDDVGHLLARPYPNWHINLDYHGGGFAKISPELIDFINHFQTKTSITLEPVYTGKMLFGLYDLIKQGAFKPGQKIIALHTGGLQGNRGFNF